MNPQDQRTIEQLLEQLAAEEQLGDSSHRYALRRSLCHSKYFEVHRARIVWERIVAVSVPTFAGGFVVVMAVLAVSVGISPTEEGMDMIPLAESEELPLAISEQIETDDDEEDFSLAAPSTTSFSIPHVENVRHMMNFVSSSAGSAFAR